ncbi:thymidine phosphorylase [Marinihelvus fidelis]|uniref:Thymidine phosphorylase n=1 Tax=Marinihelvus fidelis TaxID=2613842 RepID=A0A5N0TA95_9GAMM|nr:thymidine phosphorylase [Marinihelvus fidelis]KAA9131860.1 thymidine phosphorylase [Marinihelvus fidelis]
MNAADLIQVKRDGGELETAAIQHLVQGIGEHTLSDIQLGALLMAIYQQGMSPREQADLTLAMRDSGIVLNWDDLDGPVVDKHSTGGVGDLVSLVLAPMLAACGVYVPMISGRGLGHTGGTLDKLESIPGFSVNIDIGDFQAHVRRHGFALVGQGPDLAPADRRMYAARDVSATVSCTPLIVASILSKKLAEGLDGLVMDVKVGRGAILEDLGRARHLAAALCEVAAGAGLPCHAVLSDMNQPLASAAGNALEVREAIDFLLGRRREPRFTEVVMALSVEALRVVGGAADDESARRMLDHALDSGDAAERFATLVAAQGGPRDLMERVDDHLRAAPVIRRVSAGAAGYVQAVDALEVGRLVRDLGGGRRREDDTIDPAVGVSGLCAVGDRLDADDALGNIHARDEAAAEAAAERLARLVSIGPEKPVKTTMIYRVERPGHQH